MTDEEVRAELRRSVDDAGGITAWARRHDLSTVWVSRVVHGHNPPTAAVAKPLGIVRRREVVVGEWWERER